ncbi:MAG: peptide chain release factor 2 [Acidobacteria bacterium]|nr:peptide chain release factor 2 [Acidobacteriota bacterium]
MSLEELERDYSGLRERVNAARGYLDARSQRERLAELEQQVSDPNFWNDSMLSKSVMRERKRLTEIVEADEELVRRLRDVEDFFELGKAGEDVVAEITTQLGSLSVRIDEIETTALLSGPNDHRSALMVIHPGAGGTEAQDWAEMLMRMYLRWAERQGFKSNIVDLLPGDEAGIKSASIELEGEYAYGLLQSEIGVHRLVRISPFDSSARRHTSFASVFVYPEVDDEIKIDIKPDELRIDTYRAGGAGGQHVNRTDSAVRITHLPTNIVVQCQNERSQHKNKSAAMKMLQARLYDHEMRKRQAEEDKLEASKSDINFGSQIRNYVLAPYRLAKDLRSKLEAGDVDRVLDGDLDPFMRAYLVWRKSGLLAGEDRELD